MLECTEVTVVDGLTLRLVSSDSGLRAIDFELTRRIEGSRPGAHPITAAAGVLKGGGAGGFGRSQEHPSENRRAEQTSCIRSSLKLATRRSNRALATVTALCRLTAQRPFIPSSISRISSEGTPRMVDVMGATVTVARWPMTVSRVRTRTGRCLSGGANRHRRISPLLTVPATPRHPPRYGTLPRAAGGP